MCNGLAFVGTRRVVRFAFAGVAAALLAGCADSSRLLGDPLGNPFKSASTEPAPPSAYDMAPPAYHPMHTAAIASRPLAPPMGMPSRNVASYETPAHASPRLAQAYTPPMTDRTASIPSSTGHGTWSTTGGMSVIAATGDSASILGDRYNVPAETLLHVNGLSSPAQVHPGTRLIIPVYNANGATPPRVGAPRISAPKILAARPIAPKLSEDEHKTHDHASRARLAQREAPEHDTPEHAKMHWVKGPQSAKIADAKPVHDMSAKLDHHKKVASAQDDAKPMKMAKVETIKDKAPKPPQVAIEDKKAVDPTPTASLPPADEKVAESESPEFRWPAHGRIIQGFKTGGNDGINIAVPEGTSVKAAESGVVAYAGSEIKGFGNLVLIRHPNGYVTAYANNSDISVHRGEQVKRGQTIAKSGQSGNVASPQLHFELRKGSTPVDPTRYLAGL